MPPRKRAVMKLVCAWCREHIGGGTDSAEVSHGICRACKAILMEQIREWASAEGAGRMRGDLMRAADWAAASSGP